MATYDWFVNGIVEATHPGNPSEEQILAGVCQEIGKVIDRMGIDDSDVAGDILNGEAKIVCNAL